MKATPDKELQPRLLLTPRNIKSSVEFDSLFNATAIVKRRDLVMLQVSV